MIDDFKKNFLKKMLNENCNFAFTVIKDGKVIMRLHMMGTKCGKNNSIKCVDGWAHFDDVIKVFRLVETGYKVFQIS